MALNLSELFSQIDQLTTAEREELFEKTHSVDIDHLREQLHSLVALDSSHNTNLLQYEEFRANEMLLYYIPPILLILGTFGNLSSFLVLRQRAMAKISTHFYLSVLAVADSLVLYVGLLRLWVGQLSDFDIMNQTNWICKSTVAFGYFCSDLSVWLIVAVTVERYIAICHPLKAGTMCSFSRAKRLVALLVTALLTINVHFFWTVELVDLNTDGHVMSSCDGGKLYVYFIRKVWPWVDVSIYSFLPFLIISSLNCLIILQVVRARKLRQNLRTLPASDRHRRVAPSNGNKKLTVMLLVVSFVFLITTMPTNALLIVRTFIGATKFRNHYFFARIKLTTTITELLMYTNHSINFFLYCALGQKFRRNFVQLLRCRFYKKLTRSAEKTLGKRKKMARN